jgi:hypothetical protein
MFLAHATRLKARVKQLDFIGAFLQANTRSRIFVTISMVSGTLFPKFMAYFGVSIRLARSMYCMMLSGKYLYLDLFEFLLSLNFTPSKNIPCLFIFVGKTGRIYLLNCVNDMLYIGTDEAETQQFEQALKGRFNLELLGQAHWYLATRINKLSNLDIRVGSEQILSGNLEKIPGHSRYKMQSTITQNTSTVRICPFN